jgi:phage tail-like protein
MDRQGPRTGVPDGRGVAGWPESGIAGGHEQLQVDDAGIGMLQACSFDIGPEAWMARIDPLRNFRFRVEIDNVTRAGFTEASGLETTTESIDYREGTDPSHVRKLPGLSKYANITLKSGLTVGANALELYQWHRAIVSGQLADVRRRVAIVVQDEAGVDRARFVVSDAWPAKYVASPLSARATEVIIETLELANEGIERVQ